MRGETKLYPLFLLEKDNEVDNFPAVLKALSMINYFQPSQLATETSTNSMSVNARENGDGELKDREEARVTVCMKNDQ